MADMKFDKTAKTMTRTIINSNNIITAVYILYKIAT